MLLSLWVAFVVLDEVDNGGALVVVGGFSSILIVGLLSA